MKEHKWKKIFFWESIVAAGLLVLSVMITINYILTSSSYGLVKFNKSSYVELNEKVLIALEDYDFKSLVMNTEFIIEGDLEFKFRKLADEEVDMYSGQEWGLLVSGFDLLGGKYHAYKIGVNKTEYHYNGEVINQEKLTDMMKNLDIPSYNLIVDKMWAITTGDFVGKRYLYGDPGGRSRNGIFFSTNPSMFGYRIKYQYKNNEYTTYLDYRQQFFVKEM